MENIKQKLTIENLIHISNDIDNMYDVHTEGYEFELSLGNFSMTIDLKDKDKEISLVSIDCLNVIFISLAGIKEMYQQYDFDTMAIFFEFENDKHMLLRKIPRDQIVEIINEQKDIDAYKATRKEKLHNTK